MARVFAARCLLLLAAFAFAENARAQSIQVGSDAVVAGETAVIPVGYTSGSNVTVFSVDIAYDTAILNADLSSCGASSGGAFPVTFSCSRVPGAVRLTASSATNTNTAPDIDIGDIRFAVASGAATQVSALEVTSESYERCFISKRAAGKGFTCVLEPSAGSTDGSIGITAPAPEIDVLRDGVSIPAGGSTDLGALPPGAASVAFTIRNEGAQDLTVGSPGIADPVNVVAPDVAIAPAASVPAGASTSFTVDFELVQLGAFSFEVSIPSSDADEDPYVFTVSGVSTGPDIAVTRQGGAIPAGGSDDLGPVAPGPGALTYTVENRGNAPLGLSLPALAATANIADLQLTQAPASPVPPAGSTDFQLAYEAAAPGPFAFELTIVSDDPDESPYTFMVSGETPVLDLHPTLELENVAVDNDGDGQANPSDTVRFTVGLVVDGSTPTGPPVSFELTVPAGITILGSSQSQGADGAIGDDGSTITAQFSKLLGAGQAYPDLIRFEVLVPNDAFGRTFSFQGAFDFAGQGALTDDPSVPGSADPTRVDIGLLRRIEADPSASRFGAASALGDDLVVVAAPGTDGGQGVVFVYRVEDDGSLTLADRIDPPAGFAGQAFGAALALDGDRLLIGSQDPPGAAKGAVGPKAALYDLLGDGTAGLAARIEANLSSGFGTAVAISGDMVVLGAPGEDAAGAPDSGAVYLYSASGLAAGSPAPPERLTAGAPSGEARFGAAVGADRDKVLIGAPGPVGQSLAGSAALFDAIAGNLSDIPPPADAAGEFGAAVAIEGGRIAVGAPDAAGGGAVVRFPLALQGVGPGRTIRPEDPDSSGFRFGAAVDLDDGEIFVGAPGALVDAVGGAGAFGAVYRIGSGGRQLQRIGAFSSSGNRFEQQQLFGGSLAARGGALLIGAPETLAGRGEAAFQRSDVLFADGFE